MSLNLPDELFFEWNFLKWGTVGLLPRHYGDYFFMNERSGYQPWISPEGAD